MSWIFLTIIATILQTFRNIEQKSLGKKLDSLTVSWSRFILPFPLAILVCFFTYPNINLQFVFYCLVTALMQVAGNIALLQTFKSKNFGIGIAFYKTETLQVLLLGLLFFGEKVSYLGIFGIILATIGVVFISGSALDGGVKKFLQSLNNSAAISGLLCGLFFAISAFNLKFAANELFALGYSEIKAPLIVLLWVIVIQNITFIGIKIYQKRLQQDLASLSNSENKLAFLRTSLLSFAGSVCWFSAFALGPVIYIKAIGQLELIFAIMASFFLLKEKINKIEGWGIALTATSVLLLIFEQI